MDIKSAIFSFIDKIFSPPIAFLDLAIEKLQSVNLVTAQGLDLGQYLSVFGDMPAAWQLALSSLFISSVFLGTLFMVKSLMRLYFMVKDGVQWW